MHLKCTTPNFSLTGNIVARLQQIYFQQNEEKEKKLKQWEIWVIRINKLQGECQEKVKDLKSKGDPRDKKDLEEQIVLAKVSFFCLLAKTCTVYRFASVMTHLACKENTRKVCVKNLSRDQFHLEKCILRLVCVFFSKVYSTFVGIRGGVAISQTGDQ